MTTQSERDLLELAAKAAGYVIESFASDGGCWAYPVGAPMNEDREPPIFKWHPRGDDGDALRLAVKLRIDLHTSPINGDAVIVTAKHRMRSDLLRQPNPTTAAESYAPDPAAAMRAHEGAFLMPTPTLPQLPADILALDEAYPGMALADQMRAYATEALSAQAAEIERLREEVASFALIERSATRLADQNERLTAALAEQHKVPSGRPSCWDFAMEFLGDPEQTYVEHYVQQLEAALARSTEPQPPTVEESLTHPPLVALTMPRLMHGCDALGVPADGEHCELLRRALTGSTEPQQTTKEPE